MLIFSNVSMSYGDRKAVDGLDLKIQPGEIFGLLGPNGAGKTTTVNLAVGLLAADSGRVVLGDEGDPRQPEVRAQVGVAPQALALYEELTGFENLAFFGKMQGLTGGTLKERVRSSLDFVGLVDRAGDRVKAYSGGMKRRLNIAVAILHDPSLLLFDEPTVGVDPQSRNAIFERILKLKGRGKTIVYTTHYMEEAQKLCDRVGIIDHGRLLALDTVKSLIADHGGQSVVTAETAEGQMREATDDPIALLTRLRAQGVLTHFRVDNPDLEAVFLNLTGRALRD
ncbi:MAG: ABC transporter ATP-binding protein [Planctomycetota bacterium]